MAECIDSIKLDDWEIETDDGWKDISYIHQTIEYTEWIILTCSGHQLICADTHIVFDENYNEIYVKDLIPYVSKIITKDGPEEVIHIEKTSKKSHMYDLSVESETHRFWSSGILSHNSTVVSGYVSWFILFNDFKTAIILANKEAIAKEIFAKVQYIIEALPKWLQQGVVEWNKKSLSLENGSRCLCAATSPSAVRGMSCVTGDTNICIADEYDNVYYDTIDKFLNWKHKVNYYGKKEFINIHNIQSLPILGTKQVQLSSTCCTILTEKGFKEFTGIIKHDVNELVLLTTDTSQLKCTKDHKVLLENGKYTRVDKLSINDKLYNNQKVISIEDIDPDRVYDILDVAETNSYYTNGIVSHNCNLLVLDEFANLKSNLADEFIASVFPTLSSSENSKLVIITTPFGLNHFHKLWVEAINGNNDFIPVSAHWSEHPKRDQEWADRQLKKLGEVKYRSEIECVFSGSSYTLIDGVKLAELPIAIPIFTNNNLEIFEKPKENSLYVVVVDVSRGRHHDYSAISIIDITTQPYNIVAIYKDNTISVMEFPHLIYNLAKQYNDAYILIETNDLGESVSNTIWYEYEYSNIYFTANTKLSVDRGFPGVRTTSHVKSLGCSVLKDLIEKEQLIVNSHKIIEELGIFVKKGKSYASDEELINDDLTTTLWLFGWLTTQDIFQDMMNINSRKLLSEKKEAYINENMTPFGFYNNGTEELKKPFEDITLPSKEDPYHLTDDQRELLSF